MKSILGAFDSRPAERAMFIRCAGKLLDLRQPRLMAVLNATDDSFFAGSRCRTEDDVLHRLQQVASSHADILDIGACSTRPAVQTADGKQIHSSVTEEEEWLRLRQVLELVRQMDLHMPVSVDTFRPQIALRAAHEYNIDIINDISGGSDEMFDVVAQTHTAYVLTYNDYDYNTSHSTIDTAHVVSFLGERIDRLRRLGVADIIIDPGFGFAQTPEQSLDLLVRLSDLACLGCPVLVGISRKRMAYQPAGKTPDNCLPETLRLEQTALRQGAHILRVHDINDTYTLIAKATANTDL